MYVCSVALAVLHDTDLKPTSISVIFPGNPICDLINVVVWYIWVVGAYAVINSLMSSTINCCRGSHRKSSVFCLNSLYACLSLNADKGINHVSPVDTRRKNNVIMAPKRRHNDVIIASCAPWVSFTLLWTYIFAVISRINKWFVLYVTDLLYTPV